MKRRSFVQLGCMATASLAAPNVLWARMRQQPRALPTELPEANFTLQIGPVMMEYRLNQAVSTIGYNGRSPGPLIRMREGAPVSVDVVNDTDVPELVHWHGLLIPSEVDGAEEEETPMVLPHGRRRYQFTPRPSGLRWYHTHAMAGADLHRGAYTGQFGFVYVEPADEPGRYDQELFRRCAIGSHISPTKIKTKKARIQTQFNPTNLKHRTRDRMEWRSGIESSRSMTNHWVLVIQYACGRVNACYFIY